MYTVPPHGFPTCFVLKPFCLLSSNCRSFFCTVLAPRARGRYLSRSPCGQFGHWGNGIESGSLRNESEFKLGTFLFSKIEKHRMIAPNWGKQNGNLQLQVLTTFDSHRTLFPMRTFTQATYTCHHGGAPKTGECFKNPPGR